MFSLCFSLLSLLVCARLCSHLPFYMDKMSRVSFTLPGSPEVFSPCTTLLLASVFTDGRHQRHVLGWSFLAGAELGGDGLSSVGDGC